MTDARGEIFGQEDYIDREDVGKLILQEFCRFDPDYEVKREPLKRELKVLNKRVDEALGKGQPVWRSDQIRAEANWLLNYRAEWERLRRKIVELRDSLNKKQGKPGQGPDGSWGRYSEEWYRKLEPTVDELQFSGLDKDNLEPLHFLKHLTEPRVLQNYFWRLQISDIATTGENHRDQLAASQTALSQLMYKKDLREILRDPRLSFEIIPRLEHAYEDFMNQTQHPRTGYWGPWYRVGNQLRMVQDLSFTFHHVKFRKGNVLNLDRIAETTLNIRPLTYPYGWRPEGENAPEFSDHHNYDVVQLFFFCWKKMTSVQVEKARQAIGEMLRWCLTDSLGESGFKTSKDPFEALYFGVRFLDRIGYWNPEKRFWSPTSLQVPGGPSSPTELAKSLLGRLDDFAKSAGERGETLRDILNESIGFGDNSILPAA